MPDVSVVSTVPLTVTSICELGARTETVSRVERMRSEELAAFLQSISAILLAAGVMLLWLELQTPGLGLAGGLAALCFALVFFGRYLTGLADVPHFLLMGLGVALLVVELFVVPGTLWFGILGGIALLAGFVWSGLGPGLPLGTDLERSIVFDELYTNLLAIVIGIVLGLITAPLLPRIPFLARVLVAGGQGRDATSEFASGVGELAGRRREVARIGAPGRALTHLRPVGKVVLDDLAGEEFEALVEGLSLEPGARVRVSELRTGRLVVEPLEERSSPSSPAPQKPTP